VTARAKVKAGVRGFTMLELVLAAALGGFVILATLAVFLQIDRTETLLAARTRDSNELANMRLVIQRATSNFVMSTDPLPAREQARQGEAGTNSRFDDSRQKQMLASELAPRLVLEEDPVVARVAWRREASADWWGDATRVQRLEVVLSDSPVPQEELDPFGRVGGGLGERRKFYVRGDVTERRERAGERAGESKKKGDEKVKEVKPQGAPEDARGGTPTEAEVAPVRAIRGAFELRPQPLTPAQAAAFERGEWPEEARAWQMWWVPLRPRESGLEPAERESPEVATEFLVASNLRYVEWKMFDDGEHKSRMVATWEQQLPAYVEVSVQTVSGIDANWMFEVDWGRGPEVPPRPKLPGSPDAKPEDGKGGGNQGPRQRPDKGGPQAPKPDPSKGARQIAPSRSVLSGERGGAKGGGK
jgi:hypothetical protein